MEKRKSGLPTSPVVKKAIRIGLTGEQAFKANKKEINPEIEQMASRHLQGTVARAKKVTDEDVDTVAAPVEAPKQAAVVGDVVPAEETDIRDTTHISAEEAEVIKALAEKAEEMQKADFLKGKVNELKQELGKTLALKEKLEDDIKIFVTIADELLADLPSDIIRKFMETNSADSYRKMVDKFKAK